MDTTSPQTQSPQLSASSSRSNKSKLLLVVGAIILFGLGFITCYIFQAAKQLPPQTANSVAQISPSEIPTQTEKRIDPNLYSATEELDNFPIYPNSILSNKEYIKPCSDQERSGYSFTCDTVVYTWQTRDDYDQVSEWYKKDTLKTGWVCGEGGGAGQYSGPRDAGGVTGCKNGQTNRRFYIYADQVKTEYTLEIPMEEYKGR